MAHLNRYTCIGRLTAAPDEVKTVGQSTLTKFRLAIGRSKKNQQTGQYESDPNTVYLDCEVWKGPNQTRDLVSLVSQYVGRGDQLYVEGRLKLDEWEDKNGGGKRSKMKLVVESLELLGGGKAAPQQQEDGEGGGTDENGEEAAPPPPPKKAPAPKRGAAKRGSTQHDDGGSPDIDIPFSWAVGLIGGLGAMAASLIA